MGKREGRWSPKCLNQHTSECKLEKIFSSEYLAVRKKGCVFWRLYVFPTTLHLLLYWYKGIQQRVHKNPYCFVERLHYPQNYIANTNSKARHPRSVHISVYRKDDPCESGRHTWIHDASSSSSWIFPKRLFPDLWEILFFLVQARTPFPYSQSPLNPPIHCPSALISTWNDTPLSPPLSRLKAPICQAARRLGKPIIDQ